MAHHYLTRHAIITWLAIEKGEGFSSDTLLNGAFTTDWLEEADETIRERKRLELLSDEELQTEFRVRMQFHRDRLHEAQQTIEAGLFFNKPGAFADYGFWARQLIWSVEDCVALSLGRNPEIFTADKIQEGGYDAQSSALAKEYFGRLTIAISWIRAGQLNAEGTPGELLSWLDRARLDYAPELYRAVLDVGIQVGDWKTLYDEAKKDVAALNQEVEQLGNALEQWESYTAQIRQRHADEIVAMQILNNELTAANQLLTQVADAPPTAHEPDPEEHLDPRVRTTLYCLVGVMAAQKYQYRATDQKSPAPRNLANALSNEQIDIAEKTIRHHLKVSAEVIDRERQKALSKGK